MSTLPAVRPTMQPVDDVARTIAASGLGFERVQTIHGGSYRSAKTVIIVPTRGMIHHRVVSSWQNLIAPMNQARAFIMCAGHEVGNAYNTIIQNILNDPNLRDWDYVLTLEDDNLPPPDAHIRLLESIEDTKADAVSGIYFTKGDINAPMAYGNAAAFNGAGVLEMAPHSPESVTAALREGRTMEVNGIAMGCALWRMSLFRKVAAPWFVTVADVVDGGGVQCYTQDLSFCERARRLGARFAVDFRVRVGHLDVRTGEVY